MKRPLGCDETTTCFDSRIKELWKFGRFNGITNIEAYRRPDYLLNHDLFALIVGDKEVERTTKINRANNYQYYLG